ncbi:MAG: glycoside hydrolase family 15 protein [archaeon]
MVRKLISKIVSRHILKSMLYETGLFAASKKNVNTGYDKAWIRDNIYESLGLIALNDYKTVKKTYHALFDILLKHEYKIDWALKEKPDAAYKYIHPRYCPKTFNEFHEIWGNKQNDAIGSFLFMVGELERKDVSVIRNEKDRMVIQKLVGYLEKIEYWQDSDNGVWENDEEVHASSIGACVAGLTSVRDIVFVPDWLINKGKEALNNLLPRESVSRETDLALLSLIYPYNIVSDSQREQILNDIETKLVRERGVIRYFNDWYYKNEKGEAEWCFGFIWLAKIYKDLGNTTKYNHYLNKTFSIMTPRFEIPELYCAGSDKPNENTPLGWAQALYLVACV